MSNKILPLGGKGRENVLTKWRSTRWKLKLRGEEIARKHVIAAATIMKDVQYYLFIVRRN